MIYKYSWSGFSRPVPAEKVATHIKNLEAEHGTVTSEIFLESARDESSEMHKLFEWDNSVAAEKYRVMQAAQIIVSIRVTTIDDDGKKSEPSRVFVNVAKEHNRNCQYVQINTAMEEQNTRDQVLKHALTELSWFRSKYGQLQEMARVIRAIDAVLEESA